MLNANAFGRKHSVADTSGRRRGSWYRLLRIEQLDDRLLFAVMAPSVPLNLINGVATTTALPPSTTFVDLPADVAPSSPAGTDQTAFPTPDTLFANFPGIPTPAFAPDTKGWVFQAGGGGFATPPIDNASDNDYPIAIQTAPAGNGVAVFMAPAIDTALAQLPDLAAQAEPAESAAVQSAQSDTRGSAEVLDAALASLDSFAPSAASIEMLDAEALALR